MIAPIPKRDAVAYCYARVSDNRQIETESLAEQEIRMRAYYKSRLEPHGIVFGGVESDPFGVSASKREFCHRPAGKRIMAQLQPGDHLIIDHLDRIWRSPRDFENLLDWFKTHRITFHIVQMDIVAGSLDTAGPMGELTLRIMVAVAHCESQRNSERHIQHNLIARKQGRANNCNTPIGTKKVWREWEGKKRPFLAWDYPMRAIMAEIVRLHEQEQMPFSHIADHIEKKLAEANGRVFVKSAFYKRIWNQKKVSLAYCVEVYYRNHNIKAVCEIPIHIITLSRKYCQDQGLVSIHPLFNP